MNSQTKTQITLVRSELVSIRESLETIYGKLKMVMAYAQSLNDVYMALEDIRKSLINTILSLNQVIDADPYEVLNEIVSILKSIRNIEVMLLHVGTMLIKKQICIGKGLCRDVRNLAIEMHEIAVALEDVIIRHFNICEEIRKVYWSNFHGRSLVEGWMNAYDVAEDYAWKRYGLSDISRCFNRRK